MSRGWLAAGLAAAGLGLAAAGAWRSTPRPPALAPVSPPCDLSHGPCHVSWATGEGLELSVSPRPIALVTPLRVEARFGGRRPAWAALSLTSSTMDMGVTTIALEPAGEADLLAGQGSLPVCGSDRLEWRAALEFELDGVRRAQAFRFATVQGPPPPDAGSLEPTRETPGQGPRLPQVTLRSAKGPLRLAALQGKVVLLYFGYTFCPDICPTSLAVMARALRTLEPPELAEVRPVFISVDPERDTPARLADYAAFFHPSILGVTGTPEAVAAAARPYGVVYARHQVAGASHYVVDHSAFTALVCPDGRLAARLPHGAPAATVVAEIRRCLHPLTPSQGRP